MTCIVGLETSDGRVFIGGDSAGVAGWHITTRADEKVFTREKSGVAFAFGFCGSFRMGDLLRYSLSIPPLPTGNSAEHWHKWMATTFVDAVRACLKKGGFAKTEFGVEEGGTFFVGVDGHLYCVEDDFQVGRSRDAFEAIGCGAAEARGAMHMAFREFGAQALERPEEAVRGALHAAAHLNGGVAPPFCIVST